MRKRMKVLGVALGLAALLTLALGSAVFAGPGDSTDTAPCIGGNGWYGYRGGEGAASEAVSDLLGLTPEELCALRQEGTSLADIAAANDVTVDELINAIMAGKTEVLEARVADGTLTREQADLMIERMTERTEAMVNGTSAGPAGLCRGGGNGNGKAFGGSCGSSASRGMRGSMMGGRFGNAGSIY